MILLFDLRKIAAILDILDITRNAMHVVYCLPHQYVKKTIVDTKIIDLLPFSRRYFIV